MYIVGYKGGQPERAVEREGQSVAEITEQVFVQINTARRNLGAELVRRSDTLYRVAQEHANRWQAALEVPRDALAFAQARFYTGQKVDRLDSDEHETTQPLEIVDGWQNEPDTRKVLASEDWDEVGIGIGGSPYRIYLAVYFGARVNAHLPELEQDAEEIGLRDGLSFRPVAPLK